MKEKKIKLEPIKNLNQNNNLDNLDFTEGYVCDFEMGICGPEEIVNKQKKTEEVEE